MKLLVFFATLAVAYGAVVPRANFQENFEQFLNIISEEVGDQMVQLAEEYTANDEFQNTVNYLRSAEFISLIAEMESLHEVNAFLDFLESDNIHVHNYLEMFNYALGIEANKGMISSRKTGGLNALLQDIIDMLPKERLSALFDDLMENDAEFRETINNLRSEEFKAVWDAMWENEIFKANIEALDAQGISVGLIVEQVVAMFGQ